MLKRLELKNVGPADHSLFGPVAKRLNLLTGDNGLGKSFLLETAWWALTRTWRGAPAVPHRPDASIGYSFDSTTRATSFTSRWEPAAQTWRRAAGRPPNPGLVIYATVDGAFATWDPARNYRLYQRADGGSMESPPDLHPRWQRTVLSSLQEAVEKWQGGDRPTVQLIVATHSPLVLASVEPRFDPDLDALWKLDLVEGRVVLEREEVWHRRGDVNRWLVSDVFDLGAPTSREAESALARAKALLSSRNGTDSELQAVDADLSHLLPEMDPFFIRWRHYFGARVAGEDPS